MSVLIAIVSGFASGVFVRLFFSPRTTIHNLSL